jgi:hypothetical protein
VAESSRARSQRSRLLLSLFDDISNTFFPLPTISLRKTVDYLFINLGRLHHCSADPVYQIVSLSPRAPVMLEIIALITFLAVNNRVTRRLHTHI